MNNILLQQADIQKHQAELEAQPQSSEVLRKPSREGASWDSARMTVIANKTLHEILTSKQKKFILKEQLAEQRENQQ